MRQRQSGGEGALSYGTGPLLATGVMAAAVVVLGGVGAAAMVFDDEPKTEVVEQTGQDQGTSNDEAAGQDEQYSGADATDGAEDPEGSDEADGADPSDSEPATEENSDTEPEAHSPGDADAHTSVEPAVPEMAGPGISHHVADSPVDALPPGRTEVIAPGRHVAVHGAVYEIRWGDTLSEIAMGTGYSTDYLAAVNAIKDPDLIYTGDTLYIPQA